MLKLRIMTATVLMAVFLGVLFIAPAMVFTLFVAALFSVGAWEWSRLAGCRSLVGQVSYTLATMTVGALLGWFVQIYVAADLQAQVLFAVMLAAGTWWAVALLWIQGFPSSAVFWQSQLVRMIMGWLVLLPAWLACLYLHAQPQGQWLILLVALVVASADVGAYFSGRRFGSRKLAPNVSPGKTWEGVWGGMLLAACVGGILVFVLNTHGWSFWVLAVLVPTAMVSVVGDLLESMLKRHVGLKDSSQLLPGHGGVLDRVDGLVAAAPVFVMMALVTGWSL